MTNEIDGDVAAAMEPDVWITNRTNVDRWFCGPEFGRAWLNDEGNIDFVMRSPEVFTTPSVSCALLRKAGIPIQADALGRWFLDHVGEHEGRCSAYGCAIGEAGTVAGWWQRSSGLRAPTVVERFSGARTTPAGSTATGVPARVVPNSPWERTT